MFVQTDTKPDRMCGSSPCDDLRNAAIPFKPTERGFEYTFQQHDGTDLFQWFRRSGVSWSPCGPVLVLAQPQGERE